MVVRLNYFTTVQDHCLTLAPHSHVLAAVCVPLLTYHKNIVVCESGSYLLPCLSELRWWGAGLQAGLMENYGMSLTSFLLTHASNCSIFNALKPIYIAALQHSCQVFICCRKIQMSFISSILIAVDFKRNTQR